MTQDGVYTFLRGTFYLIFKRDVEITSETSAKDVEGWDSFAQISLIVSTEEHYGMEFNGDETDNLNTVGDFVAAILKKTSELG